MEKLKALIIFAFVISSVCHAKDSIHFDIQREYYSLNGTWQYLVDHPNKEIQKEEIAASYNSWQKKDLPGRFFHWSEKKKILNT